MAEKEIVIECGGRSYGKAAIQDLLQENTSLKRQLGGLKTSNANYRKQVENLTRKLDISYMI